MVIGVLPIGWGDGLPRRLPDNAVALIHGRRVPLLNPIHLEHLRIDLTDVPEACAGDEVVLIGRQGSAEISLEEVSHAWNVDLATFHGQLRDHVARRYLTCSSEMSQS
jgi:alanine racemase